MILAPLSPESALTRLIASLRRDASLSFPLPFFFLEFPGEYLLALSLLSFGIFPFLRPIEVGLPPDFKMLFLDFSCLSTPQ